MWWRDVFSLRWSHGSSSWLARPRCTPMAIRVFGTPQMRRRHFVRWRGGTPPIFFALGLFNASLFAASILPLSTAYTVCEGLGFESGVGHKFRGAPVFYWLYTILIAAGGGVILIPNIPLVRISILSQVINGIVLPFVLIFMLLLVNKRELMGDHVNSRSFNIIAWATTVVMVGLSMAWFWTLHAGH